MKLIKRAIITCSITMIAAGEAFAQAAATKNAAEETSQKTDLVVMNPYVIKGTADQGYLRLESTTATGIAANLVDIPLNISVIASELMSDLQAPQLNTVLSNAIGVQTQSLYSDLYYVRGFQSPGLYDGDYRGFTAGTNSGNSSAAVDRVEVIKGANSVFYGSIAPGGVINIVTARPLMKEHTRIGAAFGTYNHQKFSLDHNGVVAKEFGYRLTYDTTKHGMFYEYGKYDETVATLSWKYVPTSKLLVESEVRYTDTLKQQPHSAPRSHTIFLAQTTYNDVTLWRNSRPTIAEYINCYDYDVVFPTKGIRGNYSGPQAVQRVYDTYADLQGTVQISRQLTWRTKGQFSKDTWNSVDSGGFPNRDGSVGGPNWSVLQQRRYGDGYAVKSELAALFDVGPTSHKLLVGGRRAFNQQATFTRNRSSAVGGTGLAPIYWPDREPVLISQWIDLGMPAQVWESAINGGGNAIATKGTEYGLYVSDLVTTMQGKLRLLGGYRYTSNTSAAGNYFLGKRVLGVDRTQAKGTPQIGAVYDVKGGINVFASYSRTFVPQASSVSYNGSVAGPRTGEGIEYGLKFDSMGHKVTGAISAFDIKSDNIARRDPVAELSGNRPIYILGGLEESKGLDGEITYSPSRNYQVTFGYGYIPFAKTVKNPENKNIVGLRLTNTPKHQVNLIQRYNFTEGGLKGAFVGGTISYKSEVMAHTSPDQIALVNRGYTKVDVFLGYATNKLLQGRLTTFRMSSYNVFDKIFFDGRYTLGDPRLIYFSVDTQF